MGLIISKKNSKMGKIRSVSTSPIKGCVPGVPCHKKCYALKSYRMFPNVRKAWDNNLDLALNNPFVFFTDLRENLHQEPTEFFRWFVSGDIPNQTFYNEMCNCASDFLHTKFLVFTKNHTLDFSRMPKNLTVIASMWPNWGDETIKLRKAWVQDGTENRVPSTAMYCSGHCESCGLCWYLPELARDVVFGIH